MSRSPESTTDDDLELSLETLDQWETDLDQFAAGIMKRLSQASGKPIDVSGLIPQAQHPAAEEHDSLDTDDPEAMQLLNSLREMTQ